MTEDIEEHNFKIVLVGETGVGKTSIISQFIDQIFEEDLQTSTGGSFSSKELIFDNGKSLKLEIWDTAGQERYRALTKIFYKNASCAILVYDITNKQTFEELKTYWINQIKESAPKNIILAIVANKEDLLEKEEVDEKEARNFAKENEALFFSTSAKNSLGINQLFMDIGKKYTGWSGTVKIAANKEEVDNEDKNNKKNEEYNYNEGTNEDNIRQRKITVKLKNENKEGDKKKGCC